MDVIKSIVSQIDSKTNEIKGLTAKLAQEIDAMQGDKVPEINPEKKKRTRKILTDEEKQAKKAKMEKKKKEEKKDEEKEEKEEKEDRDEEEEW
jgi:hypothetical protein